MRIVAGKLKSMTLTQSVSKTTRPTSDSVRESIFNILANRIDLDGKNVVDLYAGTGALGLESVSRGATSATFIETDKQACDSIKENIEKATKKLRSESAELKIIRTTVLTFVQDAKNSNSFDLVLAYPPYIDDVEVEVISVVASGGYLVYETTAKKLEVCEQEFRKHKRTEEVIAARKMGNAGVVIVRAL